jgi:hypothetical protein
MNNRPSPSVPRNPIRSRVSDNSSRKSFRIRTYKSVSKQITLSPFRINTYKKHGGRGSLLLTEHPTRMLVLREPAEAGEPKDLSSRPARMSLFRSFTSCPSSNSFTSFLLRTLFTLVARRNRRNPFPFFRFRTLAKTTGVGPLLRHFFRSWSHPKLTSHQPPVTNPQSPVTSTTANCSLPTIPPAILLPAFQEATCKPQP